MRGGQGVLLSSYGQPEAAPAGDNAAGLALARQLLTLSQSFSGAAKTHQATQLALHIGSVKAGQSQMNSEQPPVAALLTSLKGTVAETSYDEAQGDAASRHTGTGEGKLPQVAVAVAVAVAAKAGLLAVAGQDVQISAGETATLAAGGNLELATAGGAAIVIEGGNITVTAPGKMGFLRGAAQARTFVIWLFEVCERADGGSRFAELPLRVQFLGIFDTVPSVGLANLMDNEIVTGHQA